MTRSTSFRIKFNLGIIPPLFCTKCGHSVLPCPKCAEIVFGSTFLVVFGRWDTTIKTVSEVDTPHCVIVITANNGFYFSGILIFNFFRVIIVKCTEHKQIFLPFHFRTIKRRVYIAAISPFFNFLEAISFGTPFRLALLL